MQAFLSPGIRLLGHFGFARKFQLLFLLFILPLMGSLWLIGQDYRDKLSLISGERAGVRQLLALDNLDNLLTAQRNRAARWRATETNRQPTPATLAAMAAYDAVQPALTQAASDLGNALQTEGAEADTLARYQALQTSLNGLDSKSLGSVGWWPDGYDRFTAALSALQALREQMVMDNRLTLASWLETYLLTQISTQQTPDLIERVGRLASVGQASVVSGQFTLQSRLQLRDLRSRIGDARDQLVKTGALLETRLPSDLQTWAGQYQGSLKHLDAGLKVLDDGVFGGSINLKPEDFEKHMDALLVDLATLRQQSLVALDTRLDHYHGSAIRQFTLVATVLGCLLLAALYLFVCLQASIRRSASGITLLAEALRDGNLSLQVPVQGRDELAAISTALNVAVVQLRNSLLGVDHETLQLSNAVRTLNTHSSGALGEVEAQQMQISQIAAAATQLAATSQGVAKSCEQASDSAQQTRRIATDSSRDSQRTTASIQQLNQRLNETAAALGRVSEQGQQIQLVVDTIRGVAEQTNLLALNAAIEAARAGEQGRGFAVVADEVRSLSQRTQSSTQQIAATVDSLRATVNEAVSLMEAACGQAQTDAQAVTGLGERLGEIASAVQSVTDTLAQIATAVDEQASTADEVSGNIQQVDQAAMRLLEGARAVNLAADTLSQGSRALSANTGRFQLG
ncbi:MULTISPECIES: methyl-accepting chemotaxis protein [Pseudomonas]|uniref:Putative methyl-accepting chemotaxis protein n=2 Tax=Pseudomonas TaxID=286 RepID=F2K5H8_PSEBN|nr:MULTISPECIES: methyl-accepting chemotaxis protein [Pseudomonas]RDI08624.1 methyl-accepting chemotaxis protein [Pseudomonas fluorescens]AEA71192.1 Putative methyl-accepting chemotaxis protein [Pseudomonas brassicacearum subsp. brassicacearum NFM421]AOS41193.1 chemotaxis protein [Pseudomonas brassicacearum]KAB0526881.1 methyl-accepting chemotaxis protein [Pseudomonas brassicacearum subsp. brassicacearum]NJP60576.1 methyl-accepting chemotaxis protein [Pseudomonas brassicacearum]